MVFHWSLSDSKSSQVSRTLLSILVDLTIVVVWMVSTRPLIFKSSSPCVNPLVTVPRVQITIGINVTFIFHIVFQFPNKVKLLILLFAFCQFYFAVSRDSKIHYSASSLSFFFFFFFFFLSFIIRSGHLAEIRWSVCMSKSQRSLCVSFSRTDSGLCIYHFFVWSNFIFLQNSPWITLPNQVCLVLYSFCATLQQSLIMGLIVCSLSPHNLHLLFSCVLFILALTWLVLKVLFCTANWRNSVSLEKFPFLRHNHIFSCEMSLISRLKRP